MSSKMVHLLKTEHADYYLAVFEVPDTEWNYYTLIRHWRWRKAKPICGLNINATRDVVIDRYVPEKDWLPEGESARRLAASYVSTYRNNDDQA